MSETVDNLILDLLEWIGPAQRPYTETLAAWRTSCPRLPVWEEATDRGLIERHWQPGRVAIVTVSPAGIEHLHRHRSTSAPAFNRKRTGLGTRLVDLDEDGTRGNGLVTEGRKR